MKASSQIRIVLKQPGTGKIVIEIFDVNGKRVYISNFNENIIVNEITVNLSVYPPGIYFCRVVQRDKVSTRKIVKL